MDRAPLAITSASEDWIHAEVGFEKHIWKEDEGIPIGRVLRPNDGVGLTEHLRLFDEHRFDRILRLDPILDLLAKIAGDKDQAAWLQR